MVLSLVHYLLYVEPLHRRAEYSDKNVAHQCILHTILTNRVALITFCEIFIKWRVESSNKDVLRHRVNQLVHSITIEYYEIKHNHRALLISLWTNNCYSYFSMDKSISFAKLFCMATILACTLSSIHGQIDLIERDMQSLLAMKHRITKDPLGVTLNWDEKSPNARNWTGVKCSTRHIGRVVELDLSHANLKGTLSPEIANLSMLRVLDLSNNSFSGIIPPSFAQFHRLKSLLLQQNNLSGSIPPRIGNISSLVSLNLSQNSLTGGIPASVGFLHNLVYLDLSRNINLGGHIPVQLGNLKNLLAFSSFRNGHHGESPTAVCNLTHLLDLDLSENKLFGPLPQCIASLVVLRSLSVAQNNLSGPIIPNISSLSELESLQLSLNSFSGPIPQEIGNRLTKLRVLSLAGNKLSGSIPNSIANFSLLATLDLNANLLGGTIPLAISQLSMLESINLGENHFDSSRGGLGEENGVLSALSNCSKLISIKLHSTNLCGTLPPSLANLGKTLQYLDLSGNSFNGEIPKSFGKFKYLFALDLADNALQGELPPSLSGMESLQLLNMTNNKFHGNLPKELVSINQSLAFLNLDGNRFSGSIPSFIGQLGNLRGLSLSRCGFTGVIPTEVGNCFLLESLDLSRNNLTGNVPREVANLRNIQECFNLSSNSLYGSLPPEIGGLQMAECIDLSDNRFTGNIMLYLNNLLNVKQLNLSFNSFQGNFIDSLPKLVGLEELDLSSNNFSGTIPDHLFRVGNLNFVDFSNNNFNGSVPCSKKINGSFLNNTGLCSDCWGLLACPHENHKRDTRKRHKRDIGKVPLVYSIVACLVVFVCFLVLWIRLKTKDQDDSHLAEQSQMVSLGNLTSFTNYFSPNFVNLSQTVSLGDLKKATDNFSPQNLIGQGSYGCVYRGILNGEDVAVKVFRDLQALTSESFTTECETLGRIRHRNLLRILGTCCTPNFKALVLPFMPNGSLASILHTPLGNNCLFYLSIKTRVDILCQLASAISYLHNDCQPPIMHCDIKPANVLLDRNMVLRLSDFGLAHLVGQQGAVMETKAKPNEGIQRGSMEFIGGTSSRTYALKGTLGYVPPEYAMASSVCREGDMYSYGVVVLEVLTRRRPTDAMFGGSLTLRSWVETAMQENEDERRRWLLSIASESDAPHRVLEENEIKAMEGVAKLGLLCTSCESKSRPTMKAVEEYFRLFLCL